VSARTHEGIGNHHQSIPAEGKVAARAFDAGVFRPREDEQTQPATGQHDSEQQVEGYREREAQAQN
jgi:hypothetical protein